MQKYFKYLLLALVVAFVVPQMALAAWWNPMSWGWMNTIFHFQQAQQKIKQQQNKNPVVGENKDNKILSDVYPLFSNLKWGQAGPSPMQRLPGYQITATGKINANQDTQEFFNYYDKKLKALGWSIDNSFAADGILGSEVGYKKGDNEIVLSYNITPGKVTSGTDEPLQYTCPCDVTYTIFTTLINK